MNRAAITEATIVDIVVDSKMDAMTVFFLCPPNDQGEPTRIFEFEVSGMDEERVLAGRALLRDWYQNSAPVTIEFLNENRTVQLTNEISKLTLLVAQPV